MQKITRFAVNYPVTITMVVLAIILLGYISFKKLSLDLFPEMDAPRIFIEMEAGERPPQEIEKQFVEDMESQIVRQKGVKEISSVCMVGMAQLTVEYSWGTDMDEAFLDLQRGLAAYSQNNNIDDFTISQYNPNASPVVIYALRNPEINDMNELRLTAENFIRNDLVRLEGIADVRLTGTEEQEVIIETNPNLLKAYGITTADIVQKIESMNRSISGGSIVEMGKKYIIKSTGLINRITDFENLVVGFKTASVTDQATTAGNVTNHGKVPVLLKDISTISFDNKEPDNIVRINGQRCLGLSVYKETGYNTINALDDLEKEMKSVRKMLPGYEILVVKNQGSYIKSSIDEVKTAGIIGIIIAVVVLYLFLRSMGVTMVVGMAIPISVVATFNLMYFNHLSLNIMTLGGLALGAGMLVDNAIVVMENIFRNKENGLSIKDAAIQGTAEVGGAIIASTLTTIVVFLPIVYLHGASAALFKDQAWTVAFSLFASLFVAIFFIPMFFNFLYKKSTRKIHLKSVQIHWYGRLLDKILDKKGWVLGISLALVVITGLLIPRLGSEYLPKSSTGEFSLEITMDEGTQLEWTYAAVENLEEILHNLLGKRIKTIYSQVGPDKTLNKKQVFQSENTASIKVTLIDSAIPQAEDIISQIGKNLDGITGMKINILRDETALQSTMGTDESPLVVEVQGKGLKELEQITNQVKISLSGLASLTNIETSIEAGAPEVDVVIDRYKAAMYNLDAQSITNQLTDRLMGSEAGKFEKNGELQNISVKLPDIYLSGLPNIKLKSGNIEVPLYEVASLQESKAPRQMLRRNQNRIGKVMANIIGDKSFDKVIAEVNEQLKDIDVPTGYSIHITGEEQKREEAMSSLGFALLLSVILVYMVMASQFESLIHPFTILLTIPLAGVGTVWAFYLLGKPLNMMAYVGIIMLGGIAVNDSIILVDFINQLRAQGNSLRSSIIQAGESRIRPIIMTSLTTILALFPLTLGFGESVAIRSSMAIAVIAGLVTSTLLTLVVIPCVYYVFDRNKKSPNSKIQ
jgi:hydrophobic/amphiphilic exporter-1 (mainly G- bacteria), HAE1 family